MTIMYPVVFSLHQNHCTQRPSANLCANQVGQIVADHPHSLRQPATIKSFLAASEPAPARAQSSCSSQRIVPATFLQTY